MLALLIVVATLGCTGEETDGDSGDADMDIDGDTDTDMDTDTDADTDADADTDTDVDADTDTDTDPGSDTDTGTGWDPGDCDPIDDFGGECAEGECCYLDDAADRVCMAGGVGEQDDECAAGTDCACGYTCVASGGSQACAHWCDLDPPFDDALAHDGECPAPAICSIAIGDGGFDILGLACDTPALCNEIDQTGCGADEGCYVIRAAGTTDCALAGDGVRGTGCVYLNDCAAGFVCDFDGGAVCAWYCNPDNGDADCTDGDICTDQGIRTPDESMPVGICTPA